MTLPSTVEETDEDKNFSFFLILVYVGQRNILSGVKPRQTIKKY